jgi:hypothetical protein
MKKLLPITLILFYIINCASTPEETPPERARTEPAQTSHTIGDTIILRNGQTIENAKSVVTKDQLVVTDSTGKITVYKKSEVSEVKKGYSADGCKGDCKNGQGIKYSGSWREGQEIIGTSYGAKYVGQFKDGDYNGQGTLTISYGDKYVGQFNDGSYNGQGTRTFANGDKYVGQFKDGKFMSGQATKTDSFGNVYVGQWKDGKKNGKGTETLANGDKFSGQFKDGQFVGQ